MECGRVVLLDLGRLLSGLLHRCCWGREIHLILNRLTGKLSNY